MTIRNSSTWGVPAHITGLFQIVPDDNPLYMGSRGAGFSIENLVQTKIIASESARNYIVYYNGNQIDGKVSIAVTKSFEDYLDEKTQLIIDHQSQLPIQGGFGTSGAGALGTAFALNELLQLDKSIEELGQIAHKAEITCKTGLGDVISQLHAYAEMRLDPGAPGTGVIKKLEWPLKHKILSVFHGIMSTKDIITDPVKIEEINSTAFNLLLELRKKPSLDLFLDLSFKFATDSGLLTGELKELNDFVRSKGYKSSMIMLGGSIFVVDTHKKLESCSQLILDKYPKAKMWINSLATKGPRIIT
jgi:pantoate kinase